MNFHKFQQIFRPIRFLYLSQLEIRIIRSIILALFILSGVLFFAKGSLAAVIFQDDFNDGNSNGWAICPFCGGPTAGMDPVVSGGYNDAYSWSTRTYWQEESDPAYNGYWDACFGETYFSEHQGPFYVHYWIKFSSNWVPIVGGSGMKSTILYYIDAQGNKYPRAILDPVKWAIPKAEVDVYSDPDSDNWGGIPGSDDPLNRCGTQAWVDFLGWQNNRWYEIEYMVQLNTGSSENGVLRVWVDNVLMVDCNHVRFKTDSYGVNSFMITNYVSGSSSSWNPNGTQIYTDNIVISTTRVGSSTPDTIPPTPPTNFTATAVSSSQINLSWTASTDNVGVTGYRLEHCQGLGCSNFTQIAAPSGTSYNDTGLSASATYSYRIRAADAAGNLSSYSNTATATTQAGGDINPPVISNGSPTGTLPAGTSQTTMSVTTNENATCKYSTTANTAYSSMINTFSTTGGTSHSTTVTSLSNGQTYYRYVRCQDASGNANTADYTITFSVASSPGTTITLFPSQDTFININTDVNINNATLNTYTWPSNQIANAILMKFNLSSLPTNASIQDAKLYLYLTETDTNASYPAYNNALHRIINYNPNLSLATGYTYNGTNNWTANSCCYNNIPLAQADISTAYDTQSINKTLGFKQWNATQLIKDWLASPSTNYGLLINSDASKPADTYRTYASSEHTATSWRPYLTITYSIVDTTPPAAPTGVVVS